ncbi:MAG: sensor domain-containing diguanylate cyclase [Syntrophotaleaceae bacterium]
MENLLKVPELQSLELALYDDEGHLLAMRCGSQAALCGATGNLLCTEDCPRKKNGRLAIALGDPSPAVATCPGGLWHYLLPCLTEKGSLQILAVGGVRSHDLNLPYLEDLALQKGLSASSLLEFWENIPPVSQRDILETGRLLRQHLIDSAPASQPNSWTSESLTPLTAGLIKAAAETESGLPRAQTPAAILNLLAEALSPHFSSDQIALFLPKAEGQPSNWIFPEEADVETCNLTGRRFPPGLQENNTTCLPLQFHNELFGCLVLQAVLPSTSDRLLLKIIADRVAGRLEQLKTARSNDGKTSFPAEYLLNRLEVLGTNRELRDLCRQILETAAQLAKAEKGSLMLLEGNSGKLRILASIGMDRSLVEESALRGEQSISALVLKTGQPLLINDLTKDQRIKIVPRPRFRTNSLLSLPLRAHQGMLGVLNLADKWDSSSFSEADLSLLSTWTGYCAPLIERLANSRLSGQAREEAAIDPLTGVYNQPILERRFNEESSRCTRFGQDMVLMLVAPDTESGQSSEIQAAQEKALVREMGELLRKMDIVGRLASGVFAILLPDTPREGAAIVAERLRQIVARQHTKLKMTVSCGLAVFPRHGSTFPALVRSAEMARQQARSNGGNAILFIDQVNKNDKIIYI